MNDSKRSLKFRAPMAAMALLAAAALVLTATPSSATGVGEGSTNQQQLRGSNNARSLLRDRIGVSSGAQAPLQPASALSAEAPFPLKIFCDTSNECPEETYCATEGVCLPIGGCNDVADCSNPINAPYPINLCLGTLVCEDGSCGIDCTQVPEEPVTCPIDQPQPNEPCTKFERGLTCPYQYMYKGCSWGELRCAPTTTCYCSEQDPGFFSWTCMMEFVKDCPEPEPELAEPEPVESEPVESEPVESEPVELESVESEPVVAVEAEIATEPDSAAPIAVPIPVTPAPIATVPPPPVSSPNDEEGCSFCAGRQYGTDAIIQFSSNNDSVSCAGLMDLIRSGLSADFCDSERDAIEAACCEDIEEPVTALSARQAPITTGCSFCAGGTYGSDPIIQFSSNNDSVSCGGLLDLINSGLSTDFCDSERDAIEDTCCEKSDNPVTSAPIAATETESRQEVEEVVTPTRPPRVRDPEELPRGFCDPGVPLPPPPPSTENPACPIVAPNGVTSCGEYPVGAECQYGHIYTGCSWDTLQCSWMQLCTCSPNRVFVCAISGMEMCTEEVVIGERVVLVDTAPGNLPRGESCVPGEELPTATLDGSDNANSLGTEVDENEDEDLENNADIVVDNGNGAVGIDVPDEDSIEVIKENVEVPTEDTVENNVGAEFEGPTEDIGEDVDGRLSNECPENYNFGSCSGYVPGLNCGYNHIYTGCSWDTISCTAVMQCTCGSMLFGGGEWACMSMAMMPCETKPDGFPEFRGCVPTDPLPNGPEDVAVDTQSLPLLNEALP